MDTEVRGVAGWLRGWVAWWGQPRHAAAPGALAARPAAHRSATPCLPLPCSAKQCQHKSSELDHSMLLVGYGTSAEGDWWEVKNRQEHTGPCGGAAHAAGAAGMRPRYSPAVSPGLAHPLPLAVAAAAAHPLSSATPTPNPCSWSTHWGDGGYFKVAVDNHACGTATDAMYAVADA